VRPRALAAAIACCCAALSGAAAADPIELHALAGPFESLDAYCAASTKRGEPCHLDRGWTDDAQADPPGAAPPFRGARLFATGGTVAAGAVLRCQLALATPRGWFVDEAEGICDGRPGPSSSVATRAAEARWIADRGAPVLRVEVTRTLTLRAKQGRRAAVRERVLVSERRWLILCGVGAGGVPRCTGEVLIGCTDEHEPPRDFPWTFTNGVLTLTGRDADAECEIGLRSPIGRHRLAF